jgi:predicted phosphodiesterase
MRTGRHLLLLAGLWLLSHPTFSQNKERPLFRFGIVADVQYANRPNAGSRHYRSSLRKLREAVDTFNDQKVDFVISLGDFINDDFHSFDTLNKITGKLQCPIYHVIGNHDFEVDGSEKKNVPGAMGLRKRYYSFLRDGWRFIILDGNDISLMANPRGSRPYKEAEAWTKRLKAQKAASIADWDGGVGSKQMHWLKKQLAISKRKKEKVIVCCHQPLYSAKKKEMLRNAKAVSSLVESYPNVKAFLAGHTHISEYFRHKDVNYVTFKGMVEKEENAFAIISVYNDRMEIKGYDKEVTRILQLH